MIYDKPLTFISRTVLGIRDVTLDNVDAYEIFKSLTFNSTMEVSMDENNILSMRYVYHGVKFSRSATRYNSRCDGLSCISCDIYQIGFRYRRDKSETPISRRVGALRYCSENYGIDEERKPTMRFSRINQEVNGRLNVVSKEIDKKLSRLITRAEDKLIAKVKSTFGSEFVLGKSGNSDALVLFYQWLFKYDKNFNNHVMEPCIVKDKNDIKAPLNVNGEILVKLEKATYVYVKPLYKGGYDNNDSSIFIDKAINSIYVYIFGKKSLKYINELNKYLDKLQNKGQNLLYTVTAAKDGRWSCVCNEIHMRSFSNLFFDTFTEKTIIDHLNNWESNESLYIDRDIMFKTGILLYGKAGTGKSSMASAIARHMNCNMISIDLNTFDNLDISSFVAAVNADKTRYVILLDEIDTIFTSRENEDSTEKQTANTMKLLSLLDSPQSPNNVIFVATTNYIDRLDDALTRKGRFDLKLKLDDMDKSTAVRMCKSFNLNDQQIESALKEAISDHKYNPAVLQDCILRAVKN